ncbi:MAG: CDP-alcohol phosphatidyltransferase family protein [Paludibacteraceae bacterium]|jgi:CDP-diacylglycerol--serine O-phosphatidyltransferase|nr:CDP-alcohol phosphatidyltransferase family protein [Paludibacteraceae bacterium]
MKKHIPNTITLLNQFSGIVACIFAYNSRFDLALLFVLIGATLDFMDGAMARLLRVSSPLGKELDSLADVITFGLVPGMIAFRLLGPLAEVWEYMPYLGFLITLFSTYRLGKFNIDERQTTSFIGLATPANAIFWLGLAYGYQSLLSAVSPWFVLVAVVVSSYLLVCELPMFSFKFHNFGWAENRIRYMFIIGAIVLAVVFFRQSLPLIILWYILLSVVGAVTIKRK